MTEGRVRVQCGRSKAQGGAHADRRCFAAMRNRYVAAWNRAGRKE